MTEFKQDDKVRYTGKSQVFSDPRKIGDSGTVVAHLPREAGVRVEWDKGHHKSVVFADNLGLVEGSGPKVGDRVRVTSVVEAVVTAVHDGGFSTEGPHCWDRKPDNETRTVEILERAPKAYPVGTAARFRTTSVAYPLLRDCNGWRNHGGELVSTVTDARVRAGEFEVIYEPPQSA